MRAKKTTLLLLKLLEKIISDESLHFRWLNTLSYLEYIGLRKILKSLPAHILNQSFLSHIHEESRHSLFFKSIAQKMAGRKLFFKAPDLLVPDPARFYFQQVDQHSLNFSSSNPFISYLYTSYSVEKRAMVLYSLYNALLGKRGFVFSLKSILNDEQEHLDFILKKIQKTDPLWEKNIEDMSHFEHQKYFSFLMSLEREIFDLPLSTAASFHKMKEKTQNPYYQKI